MTDQNPEEVTYDLRNLELRAAEFYELIRKPPEEWKSVDDVAPQLAEFEHRVRAEHYEGAYAVLESINSYLLRWGLPARLIELRKKLVGKLKKDHPMLEATNVGNLGYANWIRGNMRQLDPAADKGATEYYQEACSILQKRIDDPEIDDPEAEKALGYWTGRQGEVYAMLEEFEEATRLAREAVGIADRVDDSYGRSNGNLRLGLFHHLIWQQTRNPDDLAEASKYYGIAKGLVDYMSDLDNAVFLGGISRFELDSPPKPGEEVTAPERTRKLEEAIEKQKQGLAYFEETDNAYYVEWSLGNLGSMYYELGQIKDAIAAYKKAKSVAHAVGDARGEGLQFSRLARAYQDIGDSAKRSPKQLSKISDCYERAVKYLNWASAPFANARDKRREGTALGRSGNAHYSLGRAKQQAASGELDEQARKELEDQARKAFEKAEKAYRQGFAMAHGSLVLDQIDIAGISDQIVGADVFDPRGVCYHLLGLGKVFLATADYFKASQYFSEVIGIQNKPVMSWPRENEAIATLGLGIALWHQGDEKAAKKIEEAIGLYTKLLEEFGDQLVELIRTVRTALDMIGEADIPGLAELPKNLTDAEEKFSEAWAGFLSIDG